MGDNRLGNKRRTGAHRHLVLHIAHCGESLFGIHYSQRQRIGHGKHVVATGNASFFQHHIVGYFQSRYAQLV